MSDSNISVRTVVYENNIIKYSLLRKNVKNINLRIHSDCSISVSASPFAKESLIDDFIYRKADLILRSMEKFQNKKIISNENKKYISGESFYLLGKMLRLKVCNSSENSNLNENPENIVYSNGIYLFLQTKNPESRPLKERLVKEFYKNIATSKYKELAEKVYPIFRKYKVTFPQIKIRKMKSRWGSCLPEKNTIILNSDLILYPESCIEYVIVHEFSHFLYPNHSRQFYNFMTIVMPDWKAKKEILENYKQ